MWLAAQQRHATRWSRAWPINVSGLPTRPGPAASCWLHILELSVARAAQGRGLGAALLNAAILGAPALGRAQLSLTTDRWLAWNAPFYARHGFVERSADDPALPDWLAAMPGREAASGLDPALRCIMVRST